MFFLEYPVTRPIYLSQVWTWLLIAISLIFIALTTLINVVAVGYELVPVISTAYNSSYKPWYEKIMPAAFIPQNFTCDSASIKLNEGSSLSAIDVDSKLFRLTISSIIAYFHIPIRKPEVRWRG
jgi:hypothetical protein